MQRHQTDASFLFFALCFFFFSENKINKAINKMAVSSYLSIITLNRLNCPTKIHRKAEWIKKVISNIILL